MNDLDAESRSIKPNAQITLINTTSIKTLIHIIRGQQVILDSDLARLYEVETKALNRAAKRNEQRFPEDFRFQLTSEELENLRCQFGTSSSDQNYGGRRYFPYAYTEQGIAMLSGVLRSEIAVQTSISIMRAFVAMRHFLAENAVLLERLRDVEKSQVILQKSTDERFEKIFQLLEGDREPMQRIFFAGQMFDAFSLLADLIGRAKSKIILVDNYINIQTLNILAKKRENVTVTIYTSNNKLTQNDINMFNAQYSQLTIHHTKAFHDRFLILDSKTAYHIGASLKDAGRKCFAISLIQDDKLVSELINGIAH